MYSKKKFSVQFDLDQSKEEVRYFVQYYYNKKHLSLIMEH